MKSDRDLPLPQTRWTCWKAVAGLFPGFVSIGIGSWLNLFWSGPH